MTNFQRDAYYMKKIRDIRGIKSPELSNQLRELFMPVSYEGKFKTFSADDNRFIPERFKIEKKEENK